jgi:hypothetical protein
LRAAGCIKSKIEDESDGSRLHESEKERREEEKTDETYDSQRVPSVPEELRKMLHGLASRPRAGREQEKGGVSSCGNPAREGQMMFELKSARPSLRPFDQRWRRKLNVLVSTVRRWAPPSSLGASPHRTSRRDATVPEARRHPRHPRLPRTIALQTPRDARKPASRGIGRNRRRRLARMNSADMQEVDRRALCSWKGRRKGKRGAKRRLGVN